MVISIWSDPSNYINLLFLIRHYLKKINIILICQKIEIKNNFYYFVKKINISKSLKLLKMEN